jgi:hypothetical protein
MSALLVPYFLHCQAVSPQAIVFLFGRVTAVFFYYISFNRYTDFFAVLPQFPVRLVKSTQFRKGCNLKFTVWSGFLRPFGYSLAKNFAVILTNERSGFPVVPEPMAEMYIGLITCRCVLRGSSGFNPNNELLMVSL